MMPLHRRTVGTNSTNSKNQQDKFLNDDATDSARSYSDKTKPSSDSNRRSFFILGFLVAQLLLVGYIMMKYSFTSNTQLIATIVTAQIVALPALLSLAVAVGFRKTPTDLPHQRYIPLAAVATIVGGQLPTFLSTAMANAAIVVFGLASRPVPTTTKEQHTPDKKTNRFAGPLGTVFAAILMTSMLLVENFFIWVVSATYKDSQQGLNLPDPLQDNGQIILRHLLDNVLDLTKRNVVSLRNQIAVEWILVSGMGLSLVALEMDGSRMNRSLWSMAQRALLTMAFARLIRTFSFLITVLPSQNPQCYFSHFPVPPPPDWSSWLMVGLIPQANGGCNDLIISGHATVTSTLACFVTSAVGKPMFTASIWMFVAIDYLVEIYEGYHYSVDMWLGAILVNFIWITLAPIEESAFKQLGGVKERTFYRLEDATMSDLIKYALPGIGSYLQLNGFIPSDLANFTIVSYFLVVVYRVVTFGFEQYSQHMLICVLFLTLGVYL